MDQRRLRAELLAAEHAHQRAVFSILSRPTAWPATRVLAGRMLTFCDDLLEDMDFEDRELLGVDADDVVKNVPG